MKILKPHFFFLIVGFVFGGLFLVLTPPFQVPDEVNHFYRAYHIAQGNLTATRYENRLGGFMPASLVKIVETNLGIKGSWYAKISQKSINQQLEMPFDDLKPQFVDFPNTALYSPIAYLPQALAITLGKNIGLKPVMLLYLARLTMFLLWLCVVFYVIKILPIYKWFFALSALLPMTIFINMSVSADVVTNLLGFLWIGLIFELAWTARKISVQNIFLLSIVAILLAFAKYVYTPIILLIFLIPTHKKINTTKNTFWIFCTIVLVAFLAAFAGSNYASKIYISHANYNPTVVNHVDIPKDVDINGQIRYLKTQPLKAFEVVYWAFVETFEQLTATYIGVLGWLDVRLPKFFIYFAYIILGLVILYENTFSKNKINKNQRFILISISLLLIFLIYLSQYLSWTAVGGDYCRTIQGRYFIIVFPLLFIGAIPFAISKKIFLYLANIGFIILLIGTTQKLYERYYSRDSKDIEIFCDMETLYRDDYMGTIYFLSDKTDKVFFNGNSSTDEQARSGNRSSKVSPSTIYGATHRVYNLSKGDTLHAEIWYKGKGGTLWITNVPSNTFSAQSQIVKTDDKGWKCLQNTLIIDKKAEDTEIGVFAESQFLSYFDDFKIIIRKQKK